MISGLSNLKIVCESGIIMIGLIWKETTYYQTSVAYVLVFNVALGVLPFNPCDINGCIGQCLVAHVLIEDVCNSVRYALLACGY